MKTISNSMITSAIYSLTLEANYHLPQTFLGRLRQASQQEQSPLGQSILTQILENADIASENNEPLCQDTGVVVIFVELGYDVHIQGDLYDAINAGVRHAYQDGYLRKSIVAHPLNRINTGDNTPAIVHVRLVSGDQMKLTLAPKGGGSENMSLVKMLVPSEGKEGILRLILKTIQDAGGKPCPPLIVGVGLGGNLEQSALLAKQALLRDIDDSQPDPLLATLEKEWLIAINNLGVGPMGLGGTTTALAVKINAAPCHIASLPVAINLQCHAARHASIIL